MVVEEEEEEEEELEEVNVKVEVEVDEEEEKVEEQEEEFGKNCVAPLRKELDRVSRTRLLLCFPESFCGRDLFFVIQSVPRGCAGKSGAALPPATAAEDRLLFATSCCSCRFISSTSSPLFATFVFTSLCFFASSSSSSEPLIPSKKELEAVFFEDVLQPLLCTRAHPGEGNSAR